MGVSDPTRSNNWGTGGGHPSGGKQTFNFVEVCQCCSERDRRGNYVANPARLGLFAVTVDADPRSDNIPLLLEARLLRLRQLHGGLELCLHCEAEGVNAGNMESKQAALRAWRKHNAPGKILQDLYRQRTRR